MRSSLLSMTSHAHPLPNTFVAASVNFSLKPEKLKKLFSMVWASSPLG